MNVSTSHPQQFASDNYSGICPEALAYIDKVNTGHVSSYGEDPWTEEACDLFRQMFETECEVFFVFNGTAGNALSMAALCQSYHSIICHRVSHVETDECGAPEFFSHGSKLLLAREEGGKLNPEGIEEIVHKRDDIHFPKPKVVSITQTTEVGTVYSPAELAAIHQCAKNHHLKIQMDGARFANAVASLDVVPRKITADVGVDVLCLGGSKNGLAVGEAVIFFNLEAAEEFAFRCKQGGQLASKMRFISAQWLGVLHTGAWLKYAKHANACAAIMEAEIKKIQELEILYPREANSVFVKMPEPVIQSVQSKGWKFYTFIGAGGARLMCSWDTQEETIHRFIADLKASIVEERA